MKIKKFNEKNKDEYIYTIAELRRKMSITARMTAEGKTPCMLRDGVIYPLKNIKGSKSYPSSNKPGVDQSTFVYFLDEKAIEILNGIKSGIDNLKVIMDQNFESMLYTFTEGKQKEFKEFLDIMRRIITLTD